jgi:hypothetical protein
MVEIINTPINGNSSNSPEIKKKFETPFTQEEKKKIEVIKKLSPMEMITQEIPFPADENVKKYFKLMQSKTKDVFEIAERAKFTGVDLTDFVEVVPAVDLADRAETIIALPGLAKRFREIFAEAKDR